MGLTKQLYYDTISGRKVSTLNPKKGAKMKILIGVVCALLIGAAGLMAVSIPLSDQIDSITDIALAEASGRLIKEAGGHLRVVDIKRVNGTPVEMFGVQMYVVEYFAEVRFTKDLWLLEEAVTGRKKIVSKKPETIFDYPMFSIRREVRAGDRGHRIGSITLEKTDNGWRPIKQ